MGRRALPGPKRVKDAYALRPDISSRFNSEVRANHMMPNVVLEELMLLWLDYILPKAKESE
jgi:hypothetical protein